MSTGSTSINNSLNNIGKAQANTGQKPASQKKEVELSFTDFFSTALGQGAPQAKLNGIEQQLREALFKQDKEKKNTDTNPSAEAAQASVWAQRNWMQTAQSTPASSTENSSVTGTAQAANRELASDATRASDTSGTANREAATTASQDGSQPAESAANQDSKAQDTQEQPGTQAAAAATPGTSAPAANSMAGTAVDPSAVPNGAGNPSQAELSGLLQGNTAQAGDALSQQAKGTAPADTGLEGRQTNAASLQNLKTDTPSANNAANPKLDNNGLGNGGNNPVAQAAQQAPQLAQQMQAMAAAGEGGEEGLKIGQKILAAGGLQNPAAPNGLAMGLNGLQGTGGTAQQALIKTPVNQPGFSRELGQTVQWAIGKNLSTVDIRVNPESFGPMNMRLVQKGQQVQLMIRTQDEASANLLTQALAGLKEVLAQNGLQLNQVQIQHGPAAQPQGQAGNNNTAQSEQQQGQGQQRGQQSAGGQSSQQAMPATASPTAGRKPEGSLDLFA